MSDNYSNKSVWKLWLLWFRSIITGTNEWQSINRVIEEKTALIKRRRH